MDRKYRPTLSSQEIGFEDKKRIATIPPSRQTPFLILDKSARVAIEHG
ncbi:MAG: hypothetical protein WBQ68_10775 [Terriglobales bacterium]